MFIAAICNILTDNNQSCQPNPINVELDEPASYENREKIDLQSHSSSFTLKSSTSLMVDRPGIDYFS